jgi:hypothetical protein
MSLNAFDQRYWFVNRDSHGNGDCDQNPDRYRDSNRHSNSNTVVNSNSHSIGHIYSDDYRHANGGCRPPLTRQLLLYRMDGKRFVIHAIKSGVRSELRIGHSQRALATRISAASL